MLPAGTGPVDCTVHVAGSARVKEHRGGTDLRHSRSLLREKSRVLLWPVDGEMEALSRDLLGLLHRKS